MSNPLLVMHPLTIVALIPALLLLLLNGLIRRANKTSKLPPGTMGWLPLLGNTVSFISPHSSYSRGLFLEENIKRYGKIFRSHLFGHPTVVSCDADFNSFILQNEERLFQASYPVNIPGVLGDLTLLVVTGDVHKRLRGVALNLFASIKSPDSAFVADVEDVVFAVTDSWKGKDTLVFCKETRKVTFSLIVKKILSLGPDDPVTMEILENFTTFMKGLVSVPINLPGTPYAKAIKAKLRIKEIVSRMRDQRLMKARDDQGDQASETAADQRKDFLDQLLSQQSDISDDEVLSLVIDLLIGGYETTAMLIAIIVKFASGDQKILNELRAEHAAAACKGERLGWEDYKNMEFTQCLINEALRMGNVVKFVHRKAIKPIQYKGYEIPVGWKVLPIFCGVHLDSSLHQDPSHFNPWRWKKYENTSNMKGFMPFGGGKRLCPGSDLARLETSIFLHHLVLNYSWRPLEDDDVPMCFPYLDFKNEFRVAIQPTPLVAPSSM